MDLEIPKRFKLLGETITVVFDAAYFLEKDGHHGFASYRLNEIQIRPGMKDDKTESAFYHELMHFIIYYAGAAYKGKEDYMHQDEGFVEMCGGLLHQAIQTMEYE